MTPQQFVAKWQRVSLSERAACQQHFLDLCDLLGHPKPAEADPEGTSFAFERGVHKTGGGDGWADVWKRGHFGWEYKGKRKDLWAAYRQLLLYREDLGNPPLLVVCDMDRFEVHTNFTDTAKRVHAFDLAGLAQAANLDVLRKVFFDPQALRPDVTREGITKEAADRFGELADGMRVRGVPAERAATRIVGWAVPTTGARGDEEPRVKPSATAPVGEAHPTVAAIAEAARELDQLRSAWLNPPEWTKEEVLEFPGSVDGPWARYVVEPDKRGIGTVRWPRVVPKDPDYADSLKKRTLTNLYNERPAWLDLAHQKLDAAVFAAYGWDLAISDEELLKRLLALNLQRSPRG